MRSRSIASYTASARSSPRSAARRVFTRPSSGRRAKTSSRFGGGGTVGNTGGEYIRAMPCIVLLTDFGTRDPYVAAMKGVIAARTTATIHDLTHDIAPFDVLEAAWFLKTVAPYWAERTIFVCVVDPGVGTSRKIIAAEADGRIFLAPDNGLLTFVAEQGRAVDDETLFLPTTSTTFHGRDRFAPVAAAMANGKRIDGPVIDLVRLPYQPPAYGDVVHG